jgi:uncharacterized membrane protein
MTEIPYWVLSLAYWLHMLATVIWIGGMFVLSVFIMPYVKKNLTPEQRVTFLSGLQQKFQPVGWLSLVVLGATGMFQMSEHPLYEGFLSINNTWAVALFVKHILVVVLVIFMGIMTWITLPKLKRLAMAQNLGKAVDPIERSKLERSEININRINIVLSVLVLLFTALARSVM